MSLLNRDAMDVVRKRMGDEFPKDLVVKITKSQFSFWNESTPDKDTIMHNTKLFTEDDLYLMEQVIRKYHLKA